MNGALAATRVHQEKVGLVRGVLVQLDPVAAVDDVPTLHPGHWLMTGSAGTPQTGSMRAHSDTTDNTLLVLERTTGLPIFRGYTDPV